MNRNIRKMLTAVLFISIMMIPMLVYAQGGITTTVETDVWLRTGAGTQWRKLEVLPAGTAVAIDGRESSNTWVRGITSGGAVGWMAANYLAVSTDQVASLPVIAREAPLTVAAPGAGAAPSAPAVVEEAPAAEAAAEAPAAAPPPPVAAGAPIPGFSYGGHIAEFSGAADNAMRAAGMTWIKKQVRYNRGMAPESVAWMINEAKGRGFRILLGVVGSPNDVYAPGYNEEYAGFVAGLAALGADAIEVWNEPNIDREWPNGRINAADYTNLLAASYNAIKSTNPGTIVISGAPAPTGFFGGGCGPSGCDDAFYMSQMAAAGAANYMDCVGIHYNEGIIPPSQRSGDPRSEHYTRYFWGMVDAYWNAFGGSRPLCFTELGYLTPEGFGPLPGAFAWAGGVTVAQQAAWLDEAISLSASSGRVKLVIVWNINYSNYGADPMAGYAIIRPGGGCPACTALGN